MGVRVLSSMRIVNIKLQIHKKLECLLFIQIYHTLFSQITYHTYTWCACLLKVVVLVIVVVVYIVKCYELRIMSTIYKKSYYHIHRGYYTVAWRYEFYFSSAKQYFTDKRSEWVKYRFCTEKIKFISSTHCIMFFLLCRQKDIDKIIEGNYRNYVIDKLTCEIMENKPHRSRMDFLWILWVVYFPVKHSCLYNNYYIIIVCSCQYIIH